MHLPAQNGKWISHFVDDTCKGRLVVLLFFFAEHGVKEFRRFKDVSVVGLDFFLWGD